MTSSGFDLNRHYRQRNKTLEQRCVYLAGERERLEQLLAILLLMASRTINQPPMLILDACLETHGTNPGKAHHLQ